MTFKIMQ